MQPITVPFAHLLSPCCRPRGAAGPDRPITRHATCTVRCLWKTGWHGWFGLGWSERGVSLFLLDLNGGADDVSGNGIARLFLAIVSAFAEFERDRIGERIRATKRAQKARGEHSGGPLPFGYRAEGRQLVRVPEQQRAIKRICAWRDEWLGLRAIAAKLAERGIRLSDVAVGRVLSDAKQGTA